MSTPGDATDTFDRLLHAMPKIAESVNAFTSEDVQRSAFDALISALGMPTPKNNEPLLTPEEGAADHDGDGDGDPVEDGAEVTAGPKKASARRAKRAGSRATVTAVRDLDFFPTGKKSLRDFVAEKAPATLDQRNLVAVYYLEQVLEVAEIGVGHVLAAYKSCSWREPGDAAVALRKTASNHHWIDTSNSKAIKTTPGGRNTVEHDMPIKKEKK